MSSLIAVPPAPQSPENTVVAADGWYPEIDCNETRNVLRLGDVITHDRLVEALRGGMLAISGELRDWRQVQEAAGKTSLDDVAPEESVDGLTRLRLLWIRAVRYAAAAELAETHRDITATTEGQIRADAQVQTAADFRRQMTWAVRDILGTSRTAVELI